MGEVTFAMEADFDRSGSYETDLKPDMDQIGGAVLIDRGLNESGEYQISQLNFGLDNNLGSYTPDKSDGSLYGLLTPGVPFRVVATHLATPYTLWTGYIQRFQPHFEAGRVPVTRCTALDLADYVAAFKPTNVTTSTTRRTDQALDQIRSAMGLVAGDVSWDTGQQTLSLHFARAQDAMSAMMDVVRSEMGGFLWVTAAGLLRFESRISRLGTTVDDTWGDGTSIVPHRIDYLLNDDDLVTRVSVQATIFQVGQADEEIFRFSRGKNTRPTADSLALTAGEIYEAKWHYDAPITTLTTPVATTDYTANTAANGTGTDKTSALTVTVTDEGAGANIKLTNTDAGTIYVTFFRLRGQTKAFLSDRPTFVSAKSIPGAKADKGVDIVLPFSDDTAQKARDYSYGLLRTYRYAYPRLSLSFWWSNDAIRTAMLGLELGDLILYKDTGLTTKGPYVNDWWYVEAIRHRLVPGSTRHESQVTLIPSYLYRNLDKIIFDLFTRANAVGDLGSTTNGKTWLNDSGFDIASNKARPNAVALQAPNIDLAAADCVVEVSLSNMSADTDEEVGIVYRYTDASNYWRAYLDDGSDEVILEKVVAGIVTEVASPAWTPTDTAELRVIVQGNRHRVWVDRKLVIDQTDAALNTQTKVGLFSRSTIVVDFDDAYAEGL